MRRSERGAAAQSRECLPADFSHGIKPNNGGRIDQTKVSPIPSYQSATAVSAQLLHWYRSIRSSDRPAVSQLVQSPRAETNPKHTPRDGR